MATELQSLARAGNVSSFHTSLQIPRSVQHPAVTLQQRSKRFTHEQGETPLPDFVIQQGVGIGGFGEVYQATTKAGKEVALKRILRNLDVELRGVKQCLNLRHPNLVELYDIRHDEKETAWVVMEFIGGDSLKDVIERHSQGMPDTVVRHWFRGIVAGVMHLHDNGVVHRDLKPGNIFLDGGLVKIGDYGLSKLITSSQGSGHTESVGTFHYMAPEIGRGKYGRRIDIYALGIVLHEMVTGRVPFDGESSQEIIMKHLTANVDLAGIQQPYRDVIQRALAKDPDQRYSTVEAMAADLDMDISMYEVMPSQHVGRTNQELVVASAQRPIVEATAVEDDEVEEASPLSQEPLTRFLSQYLNELRDSYRNANFSTTTKAMIVLLGVFILVFGADKLIPVAIYAGASYAGYLVLWMLLGNSSLDRKKPTGDTTVGTLTDNQLLLRNEFLQGRAVISHEVFARRSIWLKLQELVGSMILSTIVVGVLTLLMLVVDARKFDPLIYSWGPPHAWMALTSLAGSWSLLVAGKFFESNKGDPTLRRFIMLFAGIFVGAVSYKLMRFLLVEPGYYLRPNPLFGNSFLLYGQMMVPSFITCIVYFGSLFCVLRWWKLADPLRPSRLSVLSTIFAVMTAVVIHRILPHPQGFLIAATISMATQISAPWLSQDQRRRLVAQGAPLLPAPEDNT